MYLYSLDEDPDSPILENALAVVKVSLETNVVILPSQAEYAERMARLQRIAYNADRVPT